jgi:hypothetical protein
MAKARPWVMGIVFRFSLGSPLYTHDFHCFSISESRTILLQLMTRVRWINQCDISDQISRRLTSVGDTG